MCSKIQLDGICQVLPPSCTVTLCAQCSCMMDLGHQLSFMWRGPWHRREAMALSCSCMRYRPSIWQERDLWILMPGGWDFGRTLQAYGHDFVLRVFPSVLCKTTHSPASVGFDKPLLDPNKDIASDWPHCTTCKFLPIFCYLSLCRGFLWQNLLRGPIQNNSFQKEFEVHQKCRKGNGFVRNKLC